MRDWPTTAEALIACQQQLGRADPDRWLPGDKLPAIAGCFACFGRGSAGPGSAGDPLWAAATLARGQRIFAASTADGVATAPYEPGLMALREGPVLEAAVRALPDQPEVVLVNATGRDHPRRAGVALHLGAVLGLPSIGVTHRPLLATGDWPADERGATSSLSIGEEMVGYWVRTRPGARPLAVSPGWRIDPRTAVEVLMTAVRRARTPEPLRRARVIARLSRAGLPS